MPVFLNLIFTTTICAVVIFSFREVNSSSTSELKNRKRARTTLPYQLKKVQTLGKASENGKYKTHIGNSTFISALNRSYPFGVFPVQQELNFQSHLSQLQYEVPLTSMEKQKENLKIILYWNEVFGNKFWGLGFGRTPFLIGKCKHNNCFATAQRNRFLPSEINAVMWNFRSDDKSLPAVRYPNALYTFSMSEPPPLSERFGNLNDYRDIFHLTNTYRRDSDVPYPYGIVARKDETDWSYSTGDFSIGKTNMAAWFVSNCAASSNRNTLVDTLSRYIQVDIYGQCGTLTCSYDTKSACYKMAAKKYFFYLSFENSLCKDYVTEKLFSILKFDIVPVVFGYGPYLEQAPPHSYIDVFDFHSVEALARYLIHISRTPYEYNQYFRWKSFYYVLPIYNRRIYTICQLCETLNTQRASNTSRYDLQDWFIRQSECKSGYVFPLSNFLNGEKLNLTYNQYRFQ